MTPQEEKNMKMLPVLVRRKLKGKKERTILNYSNPVKLKAVIRWKERMARAGITTAKLAAVLDIPPPRISEWLNFTYEPEESNFQKVEKALYKMGA